MFVDGLGILCILLTSYGISILVELIWFQFAHTTRSMNPTPAGNPARMLLSSNIVPGTTDYLIRLKLIEFSECVCDFVDHSQFSICLASRGNNATLWINTEILHWRCSSIWKEDHNWINIIMVKMLEIAEREYKELPCVEPSFEDLRTYNHFIGLNPSWEIIVPLIDLMISVTVEDNISCSLFGGLRIIQPDCRVIYPT